MMPTWMAILAVQGLCLEAWRLPGQQLSPVLLAALTEVAQSPFAGFRLLMSLSAGFYQLSQPAIASINLA